VDQQPNRWFPSYDRVAQLHAQFIGLTTAGGLAARPHTPDQTKNRARLGPGHNVTAGESFSISPSIEGRMGGNVLEGSARSAARHGGVPSPGNGVQQGLVLRRILGRLVLELQVAP
jgi:hypothetical protein